MNFKDMRKKLLQAARKVSLSNTGKYLTTINFPSHKGFTVLVFLTIAAATLIRFLGINFGLPYGHYWDEPHVMSTALHMISNGLASLGKISRYN